MYIHHPCAFHHPNIPSFLSISSFNTSSLCYSLIFHFAYHQTTASSDEDEPASTLENTSPVPVDVHVWKKDAIVFTQKNVHETTFNISLSPKVLVALDTKYNQGDEFQVLLPPFPPSSFSLPLLFPLLPHYPSFCLLILCLFFLTYIFASSC
jgi:hypothetical protein